MQDYCLFSAVYHSLPSLSIQSYKSIKHIWFIHCKAMRSSDDTTIHAAQKDYTTIHAAHKDDTTIHAAHKERKIVETRLQIGASGFRNWCSLNKMYINMQKTTQMILGIQRNLNRSEHIEVYLDQELVQSVKKQNLLGVIIDDTLSGDDQVEMVCLNITRRITLLKLLSKYIDKTSMNQNYNSYI